MMIEQFRLDTRPLFMVVRDHLVNRIESGELKPGALLPNELELARDTGVSIGTMRKALQTLQDDQVIVRRKGRGTFIRDSISGNAPARFSCLRDANGEPTDGTISSAGMTLGQASANEGFKLDIVAGDGVFHISRRWSYNDAVFAVEDATVAADLFRTQPRSTLQFHICAIAQLNQIVLGTAVETVTFVRSDEPTSGMLGVEPGTVLHKLERIIFSHADRPIEWRVALCYLDRLSYSCATT